MNIFLTIMVFAFYFAMPASSNAAELENISVSGELSSGLSRLKSESADFITTPFAIENGNILITLGIAGIVGLTYSFDTDIQRSFKRSNSNSFDKGADIGSTLGNPFIHLGAAAMVYGGAIVAESPKWKTIGEMLGEALVLADVSTVVLKEATGRGRPVATSQKSDFKPFAFENNYDSFPSMHTASSFAMASVIAATSESILTTITAYSAATFVGLSRIYQDKHWASDVIMAAAIGELSGRVVTKYHATNKSNTFALAPQVYNDGAGLMMVGKW